MKNLKPKFTLISLLLCANSIFASPLTESETRGKQLYLTGSNSVTAHVGIDATELPSTQLPCVGCHGEDGHGKPEGGIVPTNITFEYLTLAYGHQHDNARKHQAFTPDSIIKAITSGIDPSGNRLDYAMPRYNLSDTDSVDLIAYLKRLANDVDAGLTDTTIRIGTLLPLQGDLADMGLAMKAMLTAYIDEINAQGGIYNRQIQLEVAEFTGDKESTLKNVRHLLETAPVFLMITPFAGNLEQDVLALTEQLAIPQIAPYTLFPEEDSFRSRFTFYLLPGIHNEARAMVDYVVDVLHLKKTTLTVISPENTNIQKVTKTIEKQSQARGLGKVTSLVYSADKLQSSEFATQLRKQAPKVIFFLGSQNELATLLKAIDVLKTKPFIFVSSELTGTQVFNKTFRDKIFLSSPAYRDPSNADEFFQLIKRHQLSTHYLSTQAVCYGAVKLLAESLQKTGKELSRKKLVNNLEKIYQFDIGLMPPLSYGSNRHIGSKEVAIVPVANTE